jgi:hypothetical protein
MMIETIELGRSALSGSGISWFTELSIVDGEFQSICTRSFKGFDSKSPCHYMVYYPQMLHLCLTRFKGKVSHGHYINPETGVQTQYTWRKD